YTNNVAGKACHVVGSATQVGLTQALAVAYMVELPCPFCGTFLSKSWWDCVPSNGYSADFTCRSCGKKSYFPVGMRLLGGLVGFAVALLSCYVALKLVGFDELKSGWSIVALIVFFCAVYSIASSLVCACSNRLIKKLLW
ncbi:hypothetical protein SNE34_14770, partial [Lysobacter erysipheiresistens]